jgi:hypothetical protein
MEVQKFTRTVYKEIGRCLDPWVLHFRLRGWKLVLRSFFRVLSRKRLRVGQPQLLKDFPTFGVDHAQSDRLRRHCASRAARIASAVSRAAISTS